MLVWGVVTALQLTRASGQGERPSQGAARGKSSYPLTWSPGYPMVSVSAALVTWDNRHFLHHSAPPLPDPTLWAKRPPNQTWAVPAVS